MVENDKIEDISVLVISQVFPPVSLGGAHRWEQLCKNAPDTVSFRVLSPPPSFPFGEFDKMYRPYKQERIEGIPVTRLWTYQPSNPDSKYGRILNNGVFALLATLYVILNFWRYNCIVTMIGPHGTLLPGIVGKGLRRKWVVDIIDLWLDNAADYGYISRDSLIYKFMLRLENISITQADHIFGITPTLIDQIRMKHDVQVEKFTAIPFGIDTTPFEDQATESQEKRIIYTGNIGIAQPFEPFFKAFATLPDEYTLHMVGSGERKAALEKLAVNLGIDDRVVFRGVVPRDRIPDLLGNSMVSLVPLSTENNLDYATPTKLLESMAAKTPYIASRVKEIEKVTDASQAGVVIENDPEIIAQKMREIVSNEELRIRMGEQGISYVEKHYDWEVLGDQVGNLLKSISTKE